MKQAGSSVRTSLQFLCKKSHFSIIICHYPWGTIDFKGGAFICKYFLNKILYINYNNKILRAKSYQRVMIK